MKKGGMAAIPPSISSGAPWVPGRNSLVGSLRRSRQDRDEDAPGLPAVEAHVAVQGREDRVIAAHGHVTSRMELGATLAHQDVAGDDDLAAELLDAETAASGIAPVARGAACLFMGHGGSPLLYLPALMPVIFRTVCCWRWPILRR